MCLNLLFPGYQHAGNCGRVLHGVHNNAFKAAGALNYWIIHVEVRCGPCNIAVEFLYCTSILLQCSFCRNRLGVTFGLYTNGNSV